jgi:hypothetical protein
VLNLSLIVNSMSYSNAAKAASNIASSFRPRYSAVVSIPTLQFQRQPVGCIAWLGLLKLLGCIA